MFKTLLISSNKHMKNNI